MNDKNVVDFKKGKVINPLKVGSKNFIIELQNYVNTAEIDISKYIKSKNMKTSSKNNVTKVQFVEKTTISNKDELLEFYKQKCDENRKLPTKKAIAELVNISESTIERYNRVLKKENKIETIGKSIYLCEGV